VPKAPPFFVARLAWCHRAVGRAGFPCARRCCTCRRRRAGRRADTDAHRALSNPRRAAHPRAHVHTHPPVHPLYKTQGRWPASPRARESSPPVPATPATPPVTLSPAVVSPNPAKATRFSCLAVCFATPGLAMGRVAQRLLTLAAGEPLAASPCLWSLSSNTCKTFPKPQGFSCTRWSTQRSSHGRSRWIPCGRPPRAEPHERPHRARPQTAAPGSGAPPAPVPRRPATRARAGLKPPTWPPCQS
jgi:hypothetical protein